MSSQLRHQSGQFLVYFGLALGVLLSQSAFSETYKTAKRKTTVRNYGVAATTTARPPVTTTNLYVPEETPNRILNLRVHPFYLMQMITDRETLAAGRVDLDFLVTDKFAFGPSFIFRQAAVHEGTGLLNQTTLEFGVLANQYLTETSSAGGIVVREHVYWVNPDATLSDSAGATTASTEINPGVRTGVEVVYQKILKCGLNFEVGGGFTYHVVPYSIKFANGNTTQPDSNIYPTVSLGVGWAF